MTPAFYILEAPEEGAVPLYRFYSSSVQDTLLTVNPGKPDGPGEGIRAYIDENGYTKVISWDMHLRMLQRQSTIFITMKIQELHDMCDVENQKK